jgi:hypothetical protein
MMSFVRTEQKAHFHEALERIKCLFRAAAEAKSGVTVFQNDLSRRNIPATVMSGSNVGQWAGRKFDRIPIYIFNLGELGKMDDVSESGSSCPSFLQPYCSYHHTITVFFTSPLPGKKILTSALLVSRSALIPAICHALSSGTNSSLLNLPHRSHSPIV